MIPFCSAAGTSSHVTEMLVELMLCPATFVGGAEGSELDIKNIRYFVFQGSSLRGLM